MPPDRQQDPILRGLANISRTNRILVRATVALYVFGAVTCGTSFYLLNERAQDTRALVREEEADRVENRGRFKRSDVLLCREIESLKAQNRATALETFRFRKALSEAALDDLTADLNRNEARAGGCGDLPSVGAGG